MVFTKPLSQEDIKLRNDLEKKLRQKILHQQWHSFLLHEKKEKPFLVLISTLRFIQVKSTLMGRRAIRRSVPLVGLKRMYVKEKTQNCEVCLEFAEEEKFLILCDTAQALEIAQSILIASYSITYLFPQEMLPTIDLPPRFYHGMRLAEMSDRRALCFLYQVSCDELEIPERATIGIGIQQNQIDSLDIRSLFFPVSSGEDGKAPDAIDAIGSLNIVDGEFLALAKALKYAQCFSEVMCHGIPLGDNGFSSLVAELLSNKYVKTLSFRNCKVSSSSSMTAVAVSIRRHGPRLHALDLSDNPRLGDSGMATLANTLGYARIERLRLSRCNINSKGFRSLCKAFVSPTLMDGLEFLDLSSNNAGKSGTAALASWLERCTKLQVLRMANSQVDVCELLGGIKANPLLAINNLTTLDLSGCKMTEDGAMALSSILACTESLSRLGLKSAKLNPKLLSIIMAGILANTTGIQFAIDASSNSLDTAGCKALEDVFAAKPVRCIKSLVLSHNNFRESGLIQLFSALHNVKTLKSLGVDLNVKLGHFAGGDEQVGKGLGALCMAVPSIEALSICGSENTVFSCKAGLYPFLATLGSNRSLTRLSISENRLEDQGLEILAEALKQNQTLRVLDVDNNRANNKGLSVFLDTVRKSNFLLEAIPFNDVSAAMRTKNNEVLYKMKLLFTDSKNRLNANKSNCPKDILNVSMLRMASAMDDPEDVEEEGRSPEQIDLDLRKMRGNQFKVDPVDIVGTKKLKYYDARIPTILCIMENYLVEHAGYETVGIFRLAPDKDESATVEKQLNRGSFEKCNDVNSVANCLKIWFRQLPDALLNCFDHESLVAATHEDAEEHYANLQQYMKEPYMSIFNWLLDLCVDVTRKEEINRMSPHNLAVVFVPNLFSIEDDDPMVSLHYSEKVSRFFECALNHRLKWREGKDTEEKDLQQTMDAKIEEMDQFDNDVRSESDNLIQSNTPRSVSDVSEAEDYNEPSVSTHSIDFDARNNARLTQIKTNLRDKRRTQIMLSTELQKLELLEESDDPQTEKKVTSLNEQIGTVRREIKYLTSAKNDLDDSEDGVSLVGMLAEPAPSSGLPQPPPNRPPGPPPPPGMGRHSLPRAPPGRKSSRGLRSDLYYNASHGESEENDFESEKSNEFCLPAVLPPTLNERQCDSSDSPSISINPTDNTNSISIGCEFNDLHIDTNTKSNGLDHDHSPPNRSLPKRLPPSPFDHTPPPSPIEIQTMFNKDRSKSMPTETQSHKDTGKPGGLSAKSVRHSAELSPGYKHKNPDIWEFLLTDPVEADTLRR
eukprot:907676_1